ncbi:MULTISPECIES: GDP-mannose 4,6-dehydratase [Metallosphaera]|uniref:GDP-mannose 4,6-dehydratase n=1 Tax=Metallosphaera TaxID=41980 RepID=UPI001F065EFA|nr:GDP-mannose 4,6-dehydratase [Metallosphaera sedula]MCH1770880.1 GDP-mannose 4,6-dehydratase [Metallosphaera sedula]MCP6729081.1 GDP-mannose 4,6-dehydratase [Metallosphaera sedula]
MPVALITGVTGQDGALLSKFLIDKGYEVHGIIRRTSTMNIWRLVSLDIVDKVKLHTCDITDSTCMSNIIKELKPDELYHLAAQSHVGASFENPTSTLSANTMSTAIMLESIRKHSPGTKFYFAGTSEMFGSLSGKANESTPFRPESPYAVSKVSSYYLTKVYREAYRIFALSGILFNHESEYRGLDFVTRKISNAVARIKLGLQDQLRLGNLSSRRDWGYAPEYVEAMWLMLQKDKPDDYVIATGVSYSVQDFVTEAFNVVNLDYREHVVIDKSLYRPLDPSNLVGDYTKAKRVLGWEPRTDFRKLVKING